eukprot:scaffold13288_cov107-Isochrysis_galbana.AAC.1
MSRLCEVESARRYAPLGSRWEGEGGRENAALDVPPLLASTAAGGVVSCAAGPPRCALAYLVRIVPRELREGHAPVDTRAVWPGLQVGEPPLPTEL